MENTEKQLLLRITDMFFQCQDVSFDVKYVWQSIPL
jgi:hypothetical protein